MKKTLTVNLGGLVFNIDDDAFEILKNYLNTIKGYFDQSEGRDEIMTDIESRIAEMLQEKMHGGKEVVNATDINSVIVVMGQPEDYITEDMDDEPRASTQQGHQQQQQRQNQGYNRNSRRLYRDTESNYLGGVCSGVGYYFGLDPMWFRLLFVMAFLFAGTGFLFYIILWIIIPSARTSAEKLAMKGEPVTFDNIGKTVEEELKNVKKKLNNINGNQYANNVQDTVSKVGGFIGDLLRLFFKVFGKILGVIFIISGVTLLIALFFGSYIPLYMNFQDPMEFANLIFTSGYDFWLSVIGGSLLLGIPFLALVLAGFVLLFNVKVPKYTGLIMGLVWIIGIILSTIGAVGTGMDFSKESSVTEQVTLNTMEADTLYLDILDSKGIVSRKSLLKGYYDIFDIRNDGLYTDGVDFNIIRTKSKYPEIEITKKSNGKSYEDSELRAKLLHYEMQVDSNIIKIDPYFRIDKDDKYRAQNVKVTVMIPVGTTIHIPKSYRYLLDDVLNYHDTYDLNMVDMYWTMTDSGLVSPKLIREEKQETEKWDEDFEEVTLSVSTGDETHSIVIK